GTKKLLGVGRQVQIVLERDVDVGRDLEVLGAMSAHLDATPARQVARSDENGESTGDASRQPDLADDAEVVLLGERELADRDGRGAGEPIARGQLGAELEIAAILQRDRLARFRRAGTLL